MALTLKRRSLATQVADAIRTEILANAWQEWVPSERDLSTILHVSRNTCHKSLRILGQEMLVSPVRGRGFRINRQAIRDLAAAQPQRTVGLIAPEAMSRLRPQLALFIDEFRDELFSLGARLELHCSSAYYQANPAHALEKLTEKSSHDCWVLLLSREPLQRWFAEKNLPCVVSGSVYDGIPLPSVDQDYRATCRHAAGKLIGMGHRRLVFFNRRSRAAGDLESEAGFMEGVQAHPAGDVHASVVYHNDGRESVMNLVKHLFAGPARPTGVLVANSYCYLSVISALEHLGFRVPADVSVISRDNDSFLSYIAPEPTRYAITAGGIARRIMFLVRPLLDRGPVRADPVRVFPRFMTGASCRSV